MPGRRWQPVEDARLQELSGDMPWPIVVAEMRRSARQHGWPPRTECAIRARALDIGLITTCHGQMVSMCQVARALRANKRTITIWIADGRLTERRINRRRWIPRSALRRLARQSPELFGGLTEGELFRLLDSEPLAAEIAAMGLKRLPRVRPVVCVETGWRYASIAAAARASYVTPATLRNAVRNGWRAGGRTWRLA